MSLLSEPGSLDSCPESTLRLPERGKRLFTAGFSVTSGVYPRQMFGTHRRAPVTSQQGAVSPVSDTFLFPRVALRVWFAEACGAARRGPVCGSCFDYIGIQRTRVGPQTKRTPWASHVRGCSVCSASPAAARPNRSSSWEYLISKRARDTE